MFFIIVTWLIVAWGGLSCVYMLRRAWSRFPSRDVDDVIPFLYPVDTSLAESLLDPAAEFEYRWKLSPREFREAQRKRMRLYLELIRRMAHNSKVLVEYADAERKSADPQRVSIATTLQEKAIEVRLYSLLTSVKLRVCLMPGPVLLARKSALAHLRTAGDINGLQTYNALKLAANEAFLRLPQDELDSLTRSL
jgi:hypothetical protein